MHATPTGGEVDILSYSSFSFSAVKKKKIVSLLDIPTVRDKVRGFRSCCRISPLPRHLLPQAAVQGTRPFIITYLPLLPSSPSAPYKVQRPWAGEAARQTHNTPRTQLNTSPKIISLSFISSSLYFSTSS